MPLSDVRWIGLQHIPDDRGDLTVATKGKEVPFDIARVYYLHNVPDGKMRGGHGHRLLEQVVIPIHGRMEIMLDDGHQQATYTLDNPTKGLYIPQMIWREVTDFFKDGVYLALCSLPYDEEEYIRDYDTFKQEVLGA